VEEADEVDEIEADLPLFPVLGVVSMLIAEFYLVCWSQYCLLDYRIVCI
jgi:hypothetical protein